MEAATLGITGWALLKIVDLAERVSKVEASVAILLNLLTSK